MFKKKFFLSLVVVFLFSVYLPGQEGKPESQPKPEERAVEQKTLTEIEKLLNALKDKKAELRIEAVNALGKIGNEQAIKILTEVIKTDLDTKVRLAVVDVLTNIGKEMVIPPLAEATKDKDTAVRINAVKSLIRIGGKSSAPFISEVL